MGKIKLYKPGLACQSMQTSPTTGSYVMNVHPYKAIDGTQSSVLLYYSNNFNNTCSNFKIYENLTGYISADTEDDYSTDLNDAKAYTIRDISNIAYSRSVSNGEASRVYTIQATNNGSSEVTVNSIKFTKTLYSMSGQSALNINCLILGYFLDNPVKIPAGDRKTFVVNFDS